MTKKDFVAVRILELPGVSGGCSCGSVACSPEMAAMLQQKVDELRTALEEAYPGKTRVEYVNLKENQVSGKVAEVNPEIDASPFLINQEPYGAGWIYRIKLSDPEGDKSQLMEAKEYFEAMTAKVAQEAKKLYG